MRRLAPVACALLALSGCGGGQRKTQVAATLVPPGASSYLRIRTLAAAAGRARVLVRFPTRGAACADRCLACSPGRGPELDVATLAGGARLLHAAVRPEGVRQAARRDRPRARAPSRLDCLRATPPTCSTPCVIVAATSPTRLGMAAASKTLPAEAAVRQLTRGWQATALTLTGGDAELVVHRLRPPVLESPSALAAAVPGDAIVAAGVASPGSVPAGHAGAAARPCGRGRRPARRLGPPRGRPAGGDRRRDAGRSPPRVTRDGAVRRAADQEPVCRGCDRRRRHGCARSRTVRSTSTTGSCAGRLVLSDSGSAAANAGSAGKSLTAVSQLPGSTESWTYLDVPARPAARACVRRAVRPDRAARARGASCTAAGGAALRVARRPGRDDGHARGSAAAPVTGPAKVRSV